MDLNQLLIFVKVVENQSFTKAALELAIEKSTVSHKISQLEKHLGVRLLNRTTRLVSVTEAGDAYYQYCRQVVDAAYEAERFAHTLSDVPQGILRISAPVDFSQILVQKLIKPFMKKYPEVKIDLAVLDRKVDLVAERFDIALRIGQGSLKDSSLIGKKLFDITMGLYASPTFLKKYGQPKTNDDLQNYPFIIFSKQQESLFEFSPDLIPKDVHINSYLKINDMLTCKESAVAGLGIALLPDAIARLEVKSNKLKQIDPPFSPSPIALFAVYPSRLCLPSKVKSFLQYLDNWADLNH